MCGDALLSATPSFKLENRTRHNYRVDRNMSASAFLNHVVKLLMDFESSSLYTLHIKFVVYRFILHYLITKSKCIVLSKGSGRLVPQRLKIFLEAINALCKRSKFQLFSNSVQMIRGANKSDFQEIGFYSHWNRLLICFLFECFNIKKSEGQMTLKGSKEGSIYQRKIR